MQSPGLGGASLPPMGPAGLPWARLQSLTAILALGVRGQVESFPPSMEDTTVSYGFDAGVFGLLRLFILQIAPTWARHTRKLVGPSALCQRSRSNSTTLMMSRPAKRFWCGATPCTPSWVFLRVKRRLGDPGAPFSLLSRAGGAPG